MKITNLDSLHGNDRTMTLKGREWVLPGDMPVRTVLRLIDLQQKMQENPSDLDIWEQQLEIVYKALKVRQPELTQEELEDFLTAKQMGGLIGLLMSSDEEIEEKKTESESNELKDENQSQPDEV